MDALLGDCDLVKQSIQPAIALPTEPVAHAAGAGGFQRCNTTYAGGISERSARLSPKQVSNAGVDCASAPAGAARRP